MKKHGTKDAEEVIPTPDPEPMVEPEPKPEPKISRRIPAASLVVEYKDRGIVLNPNLIESQNVSEEGIEKLKELHLERLMLMDEMDHEKKSTRLHVMAEEYEHLEFRLQKAWGFPESRKYHRWWEVPKCTCPNMDNKDNYPCDYRIIAGNCPVHSIGKPKSKFRLFLRRTWNKLINKK